MCMKQRRQFFSPNATFSHYSYKHIDTKSKCISVAVVWHSGCVVVISTLGGFHRGKNKCIPPYIENNVIFISHLQ